MRRPPARHMFRIGQVLKYQCWRRIGTHRRQMFRQALECLLAALPRQCGFALPPRPSVGDRVSNWSGPIPPLRCCMLGTRNSRTFFRAFAMPCHARQRPYCNKIAPNQPPGIAGSATVWGRGRRVMIRCRVPAGRKISMPTTSQRRAAGHGRPRLASGGRRVVQGRAQVLVKQAFEAFCAAWYRLAHSGLDRRSFQLSTVYLPMPSPRLRLRWFACLQRLNKKWRKSCPSIVAIWPRRCLPPGY